MYFFTLYYNCFKRDLELYAIQPPIFYQNEKWNDITEQRSLFNNNEKEKELNKDIEKD